MKTNAALDAEIAEISRRWPGGIVWKKRADAYPPLTGSKR
jgi:hypothetical protein